MNVRRSARWALLGVLAFLLFSAPAMAHAAVWNLGQDYAAGVSAATQPINSVWSFKHGADATNPGGFALMGEKAAAPIWNPAPAAWASWKILGYDWQSISVNASAVGVEVVPGHPFTWAAGTVLAHPGDGNSGHPYSAIEWKSPSNGAAQVALTLTDIDRELSGGNGVQAWVIHNSNILASDVVPEGGSWSPTIAPVSVSSGESLYVVIGPNGTNAGAYYWDATRVDLEITLPDPPVVSTPASSAWSMALLAGMGLAAVPVIRRRLA